LGVNGDVKSESSVISLPCVAGDQSMFNWVIADLGNEIIRIQPQTNLSLCMDVDLLKNGAINNFPGNGQRIKLYPCHGGANQQFRTLFWPLDGGLQNKGLNFWELKPLTYDVGQAQQCVDENTDVRVGVGNLVQQYECLTLVNNRYNQHWRTRWYNGIHLDSNIVVPTTTTTTIFGGGGGGGTTTTTQAPPSGAFFTDGVYTPIEWAAPGSGVVTHCVQTNDDASTTLIAYGDGSGCALVTPALHGGGFYLNYAGDATWCLGKLGSKLGLMDCADTVLNNTVIKDYSTGTTTFFTIQASDGTCLENTTLSFVNCVVNDRAQWWLDAKKTSTPATPSVFDALPTKDRNIQWGTTKVDVSDVVTSRGHLDKNASPKPFQCIEYGVAPCATADDKTRVEYAGQAMAIRFLANLSPGSRFNPDNYRFEWEFTVPRSAAGVTGCRIDLVTAGTETKSAAGVRVFDNFEMYEAKVVDTAGSFADTLWTPLPTPPGGVTTTTTPNVASCPATRTPKISASAQLQAYLTENLGFAGGAPTKMLSGANRGSALQDVAIGGFEAKAAKPTSTTTTNPAAPKNIYCVWGIGGANRGVIAVAPKSIVTAAAWDNVKPADVKITSTQILNKCK
jgi:hypothetical protein